MGSRESKPWVGERGVREEARVGPREHREA